MPSASPLPEAAGYAVVLGLGLAFALFMNGVTWIQKTFSKYSPNSASEFSAASRSLKTGLVVAGIVSSWTWSLTLLQSATQSYVMGVSGGYWYAVGGTMQIAIFSVIASKVKINANRATTFPEVAYIRFGTAGHLAFLWCGLVCNAIVSSCILIGGGSVVTALTGMNQYASLFLIPVGVAFYVAVGGLRATFICDATHTFALLLILIGFGFVIFAGSNVVGSPNKLYELLVDAAKIWPVDGNLHGSYLTFRSQQGVIFAAVSIINGFGLVTCDQGYWSRAIASNPSSTARAYFLGGIAWFSIPFSCGTMLGLTARGLSTLPDFPVLSTADVGAGLAGVRVVTYLMGTAGSVLMLLLIFLSLTSALSAELIATSTLLSYDVYRHYFNPKATSKQIVTASRYFIAFWSVFSAALASVFYTVGINLSWLFYFLGVATASGVFPIGLTFIWKDLSKAGAVAGSIGGMSISIFVWLVTAKLYMGEITVDTLSNRWVSFAGNTAAIVSGGVLSVGLSLWRPANFDWDKTKLMEGVKEDGPAPPHPAFVSSPSLNSDEKGDEKSDEKDRAAAEAIEVSSLPQDAAAIDGLDIPALTRTFKKYTILFAVLASIITFIIPAPLGGAPYIFSPKFFTAFVAVMFIWLFFAFSVVVILPVFESRHTLFRIGRGVLGIKA
ncbi:hypothetical protein HYPSUDRAFT_134883 [Hypholoma sublateritium FD-334 SS-4]|uniref:Urea active transporter n=1 Tax=Hypholoma sublateritium (strain FD-334 SS-4) TaxID=945553 RepID=A0A0D2P9R5_HYPSF|nr:hypothetical protein HYPSUDRAFT_134883 [Hypholoma sublateritium FD-334 SS-4]